MYRRSSIQTKQGKLANPRVIMKVDLELSDEFNGGKLSEHPKAELLAGSLVDTTQAKKLIEEKLAVPRKRGSGNSAQSLSLSGPCQLSRRDSRLQRASVGDLLISIDGHCTEGGGMAARSLLRRALAREELTGGHVELLFWQPPADWAPFVLVPDNGDATPQGDSPVTGDGGRAPELSETEMLSLTRVTKRLSGGDSKSNLERICAALSLTRTGSDLKKKRRIEAELRRRCFPGFDGWTPTHDDIRSFFAGGAEGFYKKYEQTVHSVAAAERSLVLHSAAEENGVSVLREGGHRTRDARAFRVVHRNHNSKPHPRHHLTSGRSPESQGCRAGVGGDRARPEWRPRAPAKKKQTARRDQERQLLAIQSEAGNVERSGAKRSGAERSGAK